MTARDFCYWLQGFIEITGVKSGTPALTHEQMATVQKHLSLVFVHDIDPKAGGPSVQDALNHIHGGSGTPNGATARC